MSAEHAIAIIAMAEEARQKQEQQEPAWTEAEEAAVSSLRSRLSDLLQRHTTDAHEDDDSVFAHASAHADDGTLLRFLVARKMNLDDAEAMFRSTMAWRSETRVNHLFAQYRGEGRGAAAAFTDQFFYGGRYGETLDGAPLLVEKLGRFDLSGVVREGLVELVSRSYTAYLEAAFRAVRSAGARTKRRAVIVVDCDGAGLSHVRHMSVIKHLSRIGTSYYPEITRRVHLVRAGWFLPAVWRAISPLLPEHTRNKVHIAGAAFISELAPDVAAAALPPFLRGEADAAEEWAAGDDDHRICPAMKVPEGAAAEAAAVCAVVQAEPEAAAAAMTASTAGAGAADGDS